LGEATDVWGIGRIAWTLIVNRLTEYGPLRDRKDKAMEAFNGFIPLSIDHPLNRVKNNTKTTLTGRKYFPAAAEYDSNELKNLVRGCLNYNSRNRPTLKQVYDAATEYLAEEESAIDQIMNQEGLGLSLPSSLEFDMGRPLKRAKHRSSEETSSSSS
jgi:serine/threonine protein kinase